MCAVFVDGLGSWRILGGLRHQVPHGRSLAAPSPSGVYTSGTAGLRDSPDGHGPASLKLRSMGPVCAVAAAGPSGDVRRVARTPHVRIERLWMPRTAPSRLTTRRTSAPTGGTIRRRLTSCCAQFTSTGLRDSLATAPRRLEKRWSI